MADSERPPIPYDFLPSVPTLTVTSTDLVHGETLPDVHVFDSMGFSGDNASPQLSWADYPAETQSFAVTCYDPDAPTGSGFWHWVLFDIPADVTSLSRGAGTGDKAPAGAVHARNDFGSRQFDGAAPPEGDAPHRYIFAVHAVDTEKLGPDAEASPAFVGFNLRFHTLARGLLVATYGV